MAHEKHDRMMDVPAEPLGSDTCQPKVEGISLSCFAAEPGEQVHGVCLLPEIIRWQTDQLAQEGLRPTSQGESATQGCAAIRGLADEKDSGHGNIVAPEEQKMPDATTDQTMPKGKWEFDGEVTVVFDDMLKRSIPQYEVMREACLSVGSAFVKDNTAIVDIGCSRGEALAPFVDRFGARNQFYGLEISDPMLDVCKVRFDGYIKAGIVRIRKTDLRTEYPPVKSSLTLSVLTLQFTPIEYRHKILSNIYETILPGGALILVEKILGSTQGLDKILVDAYYDLKRKNGYTQEAIDRKRLSLEGVLVPLTAGWNEEALRNAGFSRVECFWRWMNFAAWVAIK